MRVKQVKNFFFIQEFSIALPVRWLVRIYFSSSTSTKWRHAFELGWFDEFQPEFGTREIVKTHAKLKIQPSIGQSFFLFVAIRASSILGISSTFRCCDVTFGVCRERPSWFECGSHNIRTCCADVGVCVLLTNH